LLTTGRRRELVVSSIMYLIGALLTAVAPNFLIMVVGRFLYGIGIGLVTLLDVILELDMDTYIHFFMRLM
jgi:predicted MFS family arabinose efflux permease